jgi:hypothetical protein
VDQSRSDETGHEEVKATLESCLEKMELIPEEVEVVAERQKVPNEEAVEAIGAPEDRLGDQRPGMRCRNPLKRRTKDDVVRRTPKGRALEESRLARSKQNSGIRYRGLRRELSLGSKKTFYEALRQTLGLEVVKRTVGYSIGLWEVGDWTLWRSRPPPKQKNGVLEGCVPALPDSLSS